MLDLRTKNLYNKYRKNRQARTVFRKGGSMFERFRNPKYAQIIISQYGGPDGELGASLRYLSQRFAMPYDELKGLLTDVGISVVLWSL